MRRLDAMCAGGRLLSVAGSLGAAITLVLVVLLAASAQAGETWDGGGADDNWTTGANWNTTGIIQIRPPNNGTANIVMPAAGGLVQTPIVDLPYSIQSLTFGSGNGRFVILGVAELTIGAGGITNNDADIQSMFGSVKLSANQTWTAAAGQLQMESVNLNGFGLTLAGAQPIGLTHQIIGAGGVTLADAYTSTVTMSGAGSNTYIGLTDVQSGTLKLQTGGVAVPGDLTIGGGATVLLAGNEQISQAAGNEVIVNGAGLLDVNTRTETLARLVLNGGRAVTTGAGRLTVADAVVTGVPSVGIFPNFLGRWTNDGDLYIGDAANGTLSIRNSSLVSNAHGYIGNAAGSTSSVDVGGRLIGVSTGAQWQNSGDLFVGIAGDGTLRVADEGRVSNNNCYIGYAADSTGSALVSGIGTVWDNNGELYVGRLGDGALEVNGGAELQSGTSYIGYGADSTGEASIVGAKWIGGSLSIGYNGHGTLNIGGGNGYVSSSGPSYIGYNPGSTGIVTVDGPPIDVFFKWSAGTLYVGYNGAGSLTVKNRAVVATPNAIVGPQGEIRGDGKIMGDVQNGGLVSPGTSPGALTIDGDYTQTADGKLLIELASDTSTDRLVITGNATLAGTLEVSLIGGYAPITGRSFDILAWGGTLSGAFSTLNLPELPGALMWNTTGLYSNGVISVEVVLADYNQNGTVDAADYVLWRKTLGNLVTAGTGADGNLNGAIDVGDYAIWRAQFGKTAASGAGAVGIASRAVPEPTGLRMLVLGVSAVFYVRCARVIRFARA